MSNEYTPDHSLRLVADFCNTVPEYPDTVIEEDGYGALGLFGAFNCIRSAAIEIATLKREARGEDKLDNDDVAVVYSHDTALRVVWDYRVPACMRGCCGDDHIYETEEVTLQEMLNGPDLASLRAKRDAELAEQERKRVAAAEKAAADAKAREDALASLSPEQRRALKL